MFDKNGDEIWARYYNECRICGTTEKPHRQEGYCVTCWAMVRYWRQRDKFREYFRRYNQKKKKKNY